MFIPQRFLTGGTGTLKFNPLHGDPTSGVNVTLYTPANATLQASTAMTAGASTTIDANSGVSSSDQYKVNVAATTTIARGDRIRLTNAAGQNEIIEVDKITAADHFTTRRRLKYDYVSADTVKELTYTYAITATHTATAGNFFIAKFAYANNSVNYIEYFPFHVKNRVYESRLTEEDLYQIFPDLDEFGISYKQSFEPQIEMAFAMLISDLNASRIDIDNLLPGRVEVVHAYKTLQIITQRWLINNPAMTDAFASFSETYNALWTRLIEESDYYDADSDGTVDSDETNYTHGYYAAPGSWWTDNPLDLEDEALSTEEDPDPEY